jgi:hypothetical protein
MAIVLGTQRFRAQRVAAEETLHASGFRPCDDERRKIGELAQAVRKAREVEVRKAWKRQGTAPVYWYEIDTSQDEASGTDEFLCRVERPTGAPYAVFVAPARLGGGIGAKLVEGVLEFTAPAELHKLETPPAWRDRGVLAVFGPPHADVDELLGERLRSLLPTAARHGIFAIRGDGDWTTMERFGAYAQRAAGKTSWRDAWSFVERAAT